MRANTLRRLLPAALAILLPLASVAAQPGQPAPPSRPPAGPPKQSRPARPPACDQARAVALIGQQAAEARSFPPSVGKIRVLLRSAGLLWPHEQDEARKIFGEALDLAAEHFKGRGDETRREGAGLTAQLPDQRFEVLREIARHDAAWARTLAERAADESKREAAQAGAQASAAGASESRIGEKLTGLATSLLEVDRPAAIGLARSSLSHPASHQHPQFFYELAKIDAEAADKLALEAVAAYATKGTTQDLSYLSIYVFGLTRAITQVSVSTLYQVPANFKPNQIVQDALVAALLARAETILAAPDQFATGDRNSSRWETTQIATALMSLELLAAQRLPARSAQIAEMRARVEAAVGEKARAGAAAHLRREQESDKPSDFDGGFEKAERETNPERRDQAVAFLAMGTTGLEQLARLETLAEKVSDANVRRQLLDWINVSRAQRLTKEGRLDDARKAAERVGELDLRAVLHLEIAREALKRLEDRARARELLDEVAAAAAKAADTDMKARARLGVAHLFASFDGLRALEVMGDAVKTINALDNPDLSRAFVQRRIEGKTFSTYGAFGVPGFSLENAFRELGPHDFEGALIAARGLSDQALRATAIVGVAAHCLEQPAKKPAPAQPARPARPGKGAKP